MASRRTAAFHEKRILLSSGLRWQVFESRPPADEAKPAILMIHGRFLDHKSMMSLARDLAARGHRVILPVLEGHRESEGGGHSGPGQLRQSLTDLLRQKGIEPAQAVAISHSEGILVVPKGMKQVIALNPYFDESRLPETTRQMIDVLARKQDDGKEPTAAQLMRRIPRLAPLILNALRQSHPGRLVSVRDLPEAFRTFLRTRNPKLVQTLRHRTLAFQGAQVQALEAPLHVLTSENDFLAGPVRLEDARKASRDVSASTFAGNSHWVHIAHAGPVLREIEKLLG